jgi:hypothetical protein
LPCNEAARPSRSSANQSKATDPLLPLSSTFNDRDVAVEGEIRNAIYLSTGLRPLNFNPVNLRSLADA